MQFQIFQDQYKNKKNQSWRFGSDGGYPPICSNRGRNDHGANKNNSPL